MATTKLLKLETLHLIPGLAEDFDQQVTNLIEDCKRRTSLAKPREITIKLKVKPHPGDPDDVILEPVTSSKMPARAHDPIRGRRTKTNQLQFDLSDAGEFESDE